MLKDLLAKLGSRHNSTDKDTLPRGIIYSATGEQFLGEAIASARSSLRFNHLPHMIFCDTVPSSTVAGVEFVRFEPCGNAWLDKVRNIGRTPFAHTIYLDTDTYVAANVEDLFDLLRRFDVAAAHAPGYTKCEDRGQSEAFHDFNTGVIVYRSSSDVRSMLANWHRLYERWSRSPPFPLVADQPAFRRALWESAVALYVLSPEYNYRTIMPGRLVGSAKILHGRHPDYEALATHLNSRMGHRLFDAFLAERGELPPADSCLCFSPTKNG